MSKLTQYIKRGLKYVLHGQPVVINKVIPQIVTLSPNALLKDHTALITGGTSGIGLAIAQAFCNAGANVIITSRSQSRAKHTARKIAQDFPECNVLGVALNNTDTKEITNVFQNIIESKEIPQIDILVNNAGVGIGQTGLDEEGEYDMIMDTNLKGPYFITKLFAHYMVDNHIKGNILNICSSSSLRPAVQPYTLSKWGMRGLTMGMAKMLIPYGITVNGLAPGPTATPMHMRRRVEQDSIDDNTPAGRMATAEEIANMAVILVSNMGKMIVGDIIYMTGGAGVITFDDINYKF